MTLKSEKYTKKYKEGGQIYPPPLLLFGIFREVQIPVINDYPHGSYAFALLSFWCSAWPSADTGTDY